MILPRRVAPLILVVLTAACVVPRNLEATLRRAARVAQTTQVLAADGTVLADLHAEIDRRMIALERIPRHVRDAVVAIEDARFYKHRGVDYAAIVRALVRDARAGEAAEGGSTITQQLVKNTLVEPDRTLKRKIREAVLARELERRLTKSQILERYLNTVYFGRGAYGIEAAARAYFGVGAHRLSLAQGALLAGMVKAPARSDPQSDSDAARARRDLVLLRMRGLGMIDERAYDRARSQPVDVRAQRSSPRYAAAYFVEHVKQLIFDGDEEFSALGRTRGERVNAVFKGGLRIHTTLDPHLQRTAERAVRETLPFRKDPYGAFVAIDPRSGGIVSLVGGRDLFSKRDPVARFDLATQARRQPASAFKPFTLVAALEAGIPLDRRYRSGSSISLRLRGGERWNVHNYEGNAFGGGSMTIERATALSVNVVYAQLVLDVGPHRVVEVARRMGIRSELHAYPSIALGAQGVSPLELASAYATLASGGIYRDPVAITSITDARGHVLYRARPHSLRVLDASVAARAVHALREVMRAGTGRQLDLGIPDAGKTGTSEEYRDAWFAGFTPRMVGVAWVGFPRGLVSMRPPRTRIRVFGSSWPGQIWRRFMLEAHRGKPAIPFPEPKDALVDVTIDRLRGCAANPLTPRFLREQRAYPRSARPRVCTEPKTNIAAVPGVVGMSAASAERVLMLAGLEPIREPRYCPAYRPGTVCEQSSRAGTRALVGARIVVAVSDDDALTSVPQVIGLADGSARRTLEEHGFEVVVVERENGESYRGCRDASVRATGTTWAQQPCAGATYGRGGRVTIFVN